MSQGSLQFDQAPSDADRRPPLPTRFSARRLESAKQKDQTGDLDGLPDRDPRDHLSDTRKDDNDVEQLLDCIINGDVFVRDLEVLCINDCLHDLGRTDW